MNDIPQSGFSARLVRRFTSADQVHVPSMLALRNGAMSFARDIEEICELSPETTLAMRKLEEALMWANKSLALHGYRGEHYTPTSRTSRDVDVGW